MSKIDEDYVEKLLSDNLKITFKNSQFVLNSWGNTEKWAELQKDVFLFCEIESNQSHPCTNVLKLWPYLEQHAEKRILLIHSFITYRKKLDNSRIKLAEWTAEKMKNTFADRFDYVKYEKEIEIDYSVLISRIDEFKKNVITTNNNNKITPQLLPTNILK